MMEYKTKDYTRSIEQIDENTRVSVVEWKTGGYSVQTQYNAFPYLYKDWERYEVLDEDELSSSQDVYGYLQAVRNDRLDLSGEACYEFVSTRL